MTRAHRVAVAFLIGVSMAVGVYALAQTLDVGARAAAPSTPTRSITARTRQLDAAEARLRAALAQRPPKLPSIPKFSPAPAAAPAVVARPQRVVFVRPPPRVVRVHGAAGEHESDHEGGDS